MNLRLLFRPAVVIFLVLCGGVVQAVPDNPVVVSPLEEVSTSDPEFVWVDQPDVTQFRLYIYDRASRQRVHLRNYDRADICDNGFCSVTAGVNLGFSTNHRWLLRARDSDGYSAWTRTNFDYVDSPPAAVSVSSPSGSLNTATPTFEWNAVANATAYRLFIRDGANSETLHNVTYDAADVCQAAICAVAPDGLTLPESNSMYFRVRSHNSGGWGPNSAVMRFSYSSLLPPAPVDTINPTGEQETATPAFSWPVSPTADKYRLYIRNHEKSETLHYVVYDASEICSDGICQVTPDGYESPVSDGLFFRVRAENDGGRSDWSPQRYFSYSEPASELLAVDDAAQVESGQAVEIVVLANDIGQIVPDSINTTVAPQAELGYPRLARQVSLLIPRIPGRVVLIHLAIRWWTTPAPSQMSLWLQSLSARAHRYNWQPTMTARPLAAARKFRSMYSITTQGTLRLTR